MKTFNNDELNRVFELIRMSDSEFYNRYVKDAPLSECDEFLKKFPEFHNVVIEN